MKTAIVDLTNIMGAGETFHEKYELVEKLLAEWAELTDQNNHNEVRIKIALFFAQGYAGWDCAYAEQFLNYAIEFNHIAAQHAAMSCLTPELQDRRNRATQSMFSTIESCWGLEVRQLLDGCL